MTKTNPSAETQAVSPRYTPGKDDLWKELSKGVEEDLGGQALIQEFTPPPAPIEVQGIDLKGVPSRSNALTRLAGTGAWFMHHEHVSPEQYVQ